jgi:hypothetical protein
MSLISRLGVVLGLDAGEFNANLGKAQERLQGFNQQILGSRLGVAAIATALVTAAVSAVRFADSINDISQASELSIQEVLRLNEALMTNGGHADSAAKMVSQFTRKVYEANDGNEKLRESFSKVGISMEDLKKMPMDKLLEKSITGFKNLKDASERTGIAFEIFSRASKNIDFGGVADQLDKNKNAYQDAEKAFIQIGNAIDNLQKIGFTMKTGFAVQVGAAFEYVTDKAIDFYNMMAKINKYLTDHLGSFKYAIPGVPYLPNSEITKRPDGTSANAIKDEENRAQAMSKTLEKQTEFYKKELMIVEAKRQRIVEEQGLAFIGNSEKKLALDLFDIEKKRLLLIQEKKMTKEQANEWAQSEVNLAHFTYQSEQAQKTFEFGWRTAYKNYMQNATDAAKMGEQAFVSLTQNMESALDKFVQTGKLSFKDLAASIIADLIKIQMRAQMTSLFGGLGNLLGGIFNTGGTGEAFTHSIFSAGGNELGAGQPSMVGENGPEMFIPKSAGTIVPNNRVNSLLGNQAQVVYNGPYIANMSAIDTQTGLQFLAKNKQGVWAANQSAQRGIPQSR